MTTYSDLEQLKVFLEENVCKNIRLKVPDDEFEQEEYSIRLDHPTVSILRSRRINNELDNYYSAPQIIIRFINQDDTAINSKIRQKEYLINLQVICWNNGIHSKELYSRNELMEFETNSNPQEYFAINDGSKDVITLCDMIIQALLDHGWIDENHSIRIDEETISTGPLRDDTGPADLEPYFVHLIEFQMRSKYSRNAFDQRQGLQERKMNG